MNDLSVLFRSRIGLPEDVEITLSDVERVLEQMAVTVPFENLAIMGQRTSVIKKENLIDKILIRQEGGLCYELNPILYFFLIENGFQAVLTRGRIYDNASQQYLTLGRTHVTILLTHEDHTFLVDTGFGGNLPLKPVPLTGETVLSRNGQFRVREERGEHGDYVLEMKLAHRHQDWRIGYAFFADQPTADLDELNEIQHIIQYDPQSPFNKKPLATKLTERGSLTLTDTTFTRRDEGKVTKEEIAPAQFSVLLKQHFGLSDGVHFHS